MKVYTFSHQESSAAAAAQFGAEQLRQVIADKGEANIIVATGASQLDMLAALILEKGVKWSRVTVFHLDEYIGLPLSHPASFRKYLWDRFHSQLPEPLQAFHYISGEGDVQAVCDRIGGLLRQHPIDVCFAGIGENAHLAFNDPPADFETELAYQIVELDDACRQQQLGEGWFTSFEEVPTHAVSMGIRQIMKSKCMVITVPDKRKARAVRDSLEGEVTNWVPASILQQHPNAQIYLDKESASMLSEGQNR